MDKQLLDLYSDYLISSFSYTTATGLSEALEGSISHDKITRFLSKEEYNSKALWKLVKPTVRNIEGEDGILIFDDTIEEKPYTDENELITYYFDHTFGRNVKGVNILSCLYHNQGVTIPVSFQPIRKTKLYIDKNSGRERRKSEKTKNEYLRDMAKVATVDNRIKYRFIVADVWFSSNDNMEYIKFDLKKEFVIPIKTNRLIAFSKQEAREGQFKRVDECRIEQDLPQKVYLKELPFPVALLKQVFKNEDGSEGILYLVYSDLTASADQIKTVYQKRWHIEEYHKSLKSNLALVKSPTKTVITQSNHFFASIYSFFKLEMLKLKHKLNHFALKAKLYVQALRMSMAELEKLKLVT